jgi:hypothetical protein
VLGSALQAHGLVQEQSELHSHDEEKEMQPVATVSVRAANGIIYFIF